MPCQKDNPCNRENFDIAVALLNLEFPERGFYIEKTWMDFGAGMSWENILCHKPDSRWGDYQYLYPADWDRLDTATNALELMEAVKRLIVRDRSGEY